MHQLMARRLAGAMMALALASAGVLVFAAPAQAYMAPEREMASSAWDTVRQKDAVVGCPSGTVAYGFGGKITGGDGRVLMTAVGPSADLSSVTVSGLARPGIVGPWSVTAYAVCADPTGYNPHLVTQLGFAARATATCPDGEVAYGAGYRLLEPIGDVFVDEVVPDPLVTSVSVHADGPDRRLFQVVAKAVCGLQFGGSHFRIEAASTFDDSSPKSVTATNTWIGGGYVFAVGALAGGEDVFLDALVPNATLDSVHVRATRAAEPIIIEPVPIEGPVAALTAGNTQDDEGDVDDDWEVIAYGGIGSWY